MAGSLIGTKKLLLFNKHNEETARFQSVAPNLNLEISLEAKQRNFPENSRFAGTCVCKLGICVSLVGRPERAEAAKARILGRDQKVASF